MFDSFRVFVTITMTNKRLCFERRPILANFQRSDTGKYNKSLKENRERGFTNVTKIPKIPIIPKITSITNQGSDTGK